MASLANITVKKYDGTTDIVYTGVSPQGDSQPARWASQTVGSASAHQPDLRILVKERGSVVHIKGTYKYPELSTNSTTGKTSVVRSLSGSFSFDYERTMVQTDINEATAQFLNLCAAAIVKTMSREGVGAL